MNLKTSCQIAIFFALLVGCGAITDPEVVPYSTQDVQVDSSLEANIGGPRLCVSGPNVYTVWHDDRRSGDRNQVFFNVGRGGGTSWGSEDKQLSADPTGDSVAEQPDIACAGTSVYVVWEDDRDSDIGHKSIYFTYSNDGGDTWSENQRITDDPDGDFDALGARVAVDYDPAVGPDHELSIVWYDDRRGAYDIYFTRATNGYNFLPAELRVDTDVPGAAYSAHPRLATDGRGGVFVVWEDSRSGGNDVYANRSLDYGNTWGANDIRIDGGDAAGASDAFGIELAVDSAVTPTAVYAVWHDDRNGGRDIYLNSSLDAGGSWSTEAQRIDNDGEGASDSFYPSLVVQDQRVLVAWHDDRDVGFDVWSRGSDNGGSTWASEVRLDSDIAGSAHSVGVRLARDGDRVAAVWSDYRRGPTVEGEIHPDLYYSMSQDEGYIWSEEEQRIDDDPQNTAISDQPQVVLAGPSLYVLWVDYRSGNADLWFRRMSSSN
jgi:hypothetical protein